MLPQGGSGPGRWAVEPDAGRRATHLRQTTLPAPSTASGGGQGLFPLRDSTGAPAATQALGRVGEESCSPETTPGVGVGVGSVSAFSSSNPSTAMEGPAVASATIPIPATVMGPAATMGPLAAVTVPVYSTPAATMPLLGQLPQIPKFSGDAQDNGETFLDWHEQFDNIAKLVGWDDHWKLVHLTSNLRGTAASFYRSCGVDVRSQYKCLVEAMKRRFTPVHLTAVQTQLFHARLQGEGETVEQFAQEIQKLFNQAYARAAQEGTEAEKLAKTLLANQFVTGLRPELKRKLIGVEGRLEELILKARFEEVKGRELALEVNRSTVTKQHTPKPKLTQLMLPSQVSTAQAPSEPAQKADASASSSTSRVGRMKCFNCGLEGHMARACPYPRKSRRDDEARGRREPAVSALASGEEDQKQIEELRRQLQEAEARAALRAKTSTLHTVAADDQDCLLGPTVFAEILVNGVPTKTLIDTGSPATSVSLDFVLDLFADQPDRRQTPEQWREKTMKRFSPPEISLRNYGGDSLNIISQTKLNLSQGSRAVDATVLVQKGAPHNLLMGTDVQSKLGFALVLETAEKTVDLLTGKESRVGHPTQSQTTCADAVHPREGDSEPDLPQGGEATVEDHCLQTPPCLSSAGGPTGSCIEGGSISDEQLDEGLCEESQGAGQKPFGLHPETDALGEDPETIRTGVVRLLKTVKVPPGYQKAVRACICGELESSLLLFTPYIEHQYLLLPDGAIE